VRVLDFVTMWEFLGILILTIFKMLIDIARFLIVFIIIVLGFTSAFHLSYSGTSVSSYAAFATGNIYVFTTTPSGYSPPEYFNILGSPASGFGMFCQIIYVFIGIILLLNLLIALMSDTYQFMGGQAEEEYRWSVAEPLFGANRIFALWPSPFSVLQFIIGVPWIIFELVFARLERFEERLKLEQLPEFSSSLARVLYANMVMHYFKENDELKQFLMTDYGTLLGKKDDTNLIK